LLPIQSLPRFQLANNRRGASTFTSKPRVFLTCRLYVILFLLILLLTPLSPVDADEPPSNAYLIELIEKAVQAKLAGEREWHLLLHYRENLFGGHTSEQDDPGFFMSPDGKTDPQAELSATLKQFFSKDFVGRSKQPAQCAFIARYEWLKQRLAFDQTRLPPQPCERFERWFADFDAESVSLIFASGFMNNPSSTFGHTFLRVDQRGQTDQTRILAYTINYAAELPPNTGPEYAVKGIFGGYPGYFSTIPYYLKVQEYGDMEDRDIWEYKLNFTPDQLRRLLTHAWEMGNAYFDYFFFKENCSYHILSLVEFAEPSLHLTDRFAFYTMPTDTIRRLMEKPEAASTVVYRPSRGTLVRKKKAFLQDQEYQWLQRMIVTPSSAKDPEFQNLPPERRATVMDIASDYLLLKSSGERLNNNPYQQLNRELLLERSLLKVRPESIAISPFTDRPDSGHGTSRASVGIGWRNKQLYEELAIRAAYHDLLDPQKGYTPDAQIEALSLAVRQYSPINWQESSFEKNLGDTQLRIEQFTLLNMVSLSPMDGLFHAPSWKFGLGMNTIRHNNCRLCSNGYFNVGIGGSIESHWLKRELFFAFAETEANYSGAYEERHRAGGGGSVGMLSDLTEKWKLLVSGTYLRYPLGNKGDDLRWTVGQRFTLLQNLAIRLDYNHRDRDDDVIFSMQAFF
jgi:Domain of unknown function (DUF4105)